MAHKEEDRECIVLDAATRNITASDIMTLSLAITNASLSIMTLNSNCHYVECRLCCYIFYWFAEYHNSECRYVECLGAYSIGTILADIFMKEYFYIIISFIYIYIYSLDK